MRILAINYEYPPLGGGGGVIFKQLYDEMSQRHRVTVLTTHFRDLPLHETRGNQQVHRVRVFGRKKLSTATMSSMLTFPPASWMYGRKLLSSERFDIINSHFVVPTAPSGQLLASSFRVPHVLSVHGGDLYDPSKKMSPHRLPLVPRLIRQLLRKADRVVANSRNTADNARRIYRVDRPIDIIPLAIVPRPVARKDRAAVGIGEERFVMVTIGRLIARKGLEELLHLVRELDDARDLLVVIGSGPEHESLERLAGELGIKKRVRFTGWIDEEEKWDLLAASDLYVSTSVHEGFGLVFLEAMHCGLPVVCYDHGGQTDFLTDGETGALVPAGDPAGFVAAVRVLKESAELAAKCASQNLERVREFYIDRYSQRYEELFEEVISSRRAARSREVRGAEERGGG